MFVVRYQPSYPIKRYHLHCDYQQVQLMLAVSMQAPDNCDVHVVLGVLYNVSQDYDGAIECFRKSLALQPGLLPYKHVRT